jgi:hypothetical protein
MIRRGFTGTVWFVAGVFTAIVMSYYLYRIGVPLKPFIYQAF